MSPKVRSLRERKTTRTRQAIVSTARELIRRQGFEATTLDQIAELADVHKQTVLRYFGSKEEIALAYRYEWLAKFKAILSDPDAGPDVIHRWRVCVRQASAELSKQPNLFDYFMLIMSNPRILAHSLYVDSKYEAVLMEAIGKETGRNPDTDVDVQLLAAFLVQTQRVIMNMAMRAGSRADLPRLSLYVVDFAMKHFPKIEAKRKR